MRDRKEVEQGRDANKTLISIELLLDIRELLIEQKKIAIGLLEHRGSIQIIK